MEIFGKRPFVLKTKEMDGKINAIQVSNGYENEECESMVKAIKNDIQGFFVYYAGVFKGMQEAASDLKKSFKKDGSLSAGAVGKLDDLFKGFLKLLEEKDIEERLKLCIGKETFNYLKGFYLSPLSEESKEKTTLETLETLEKNSRKAKQGLKDSFEKVCKALKSFIKKWEKTDKVNEKIGREDDKENIRDVAKSEIEVFKKYGILERITTEQDDGGLLGFDEEEEEEAYNGDDEEDGF